MELLGTLIPLCALAALAAGLAAFCRLPAGAAPLVAVSLAMVWCSVCGCLGLLVPGGWLFLAAGAGCAVALTVKRRWRAALDPAFLLFCAAALALLALLAYKKPLFSTWDEFSFWGTAVKLCVQSGGLYTTAEVGWPWVASQKPGVVLLAWLFDHLGPYAEWRAYFGIALAALAVMALLAAQGGKKWFCVGAAGAGAAFFLPWLLTLYRTPATLTEPYVTALGDMPMAWLFGGAVLLWFLLRAPQNQNAPLGWVLPVLAALTLVRDTAFPLALIAAGLLAADLLWNGRAFTFGPLHGLGAKWAAIAAAFAVPVVTFVGWALYLQGATGADAIGNIGGTEQMSMFGMLQSGLLQLLGIGTTEKFRSIMDMMGQYWLTLRATLLGSGAVVTAVIAVLVALAAWLAGPGALRRRALLFGVFSAAGFWAFHTFTGFTYVFVFRIDEMQGSLVGYERYTYPYYIGWLLAALGLLVGAAAAGRGRRRLLAGLAVYALLGLFAVRVWQVVPPDLTFIGYHDSSQQARRHLQTAATGTKALLEGEPAAPVFFIEQGDNGSGWFTCAYELLPVQLDYSYGGGTLGTAEHMADVDAGLYAIPVERDALADYLRESGCGYVLVVRSDAVLEASYGDWFADGLAACENGGSALYRIEWPQSGGAPHFALLGEVAG